MANDLTAERWQKIKELFHAALELHANERRAFLDEACAGDEEIRQEVESLLAEHEQPYSLIDRPAFEVAADLLATEEFSSEAEQAIGPYNIIGQIGRGGMGEVYLAQDTRLGRRVALKLLPSRFTSDQDRLRRFKQEARAASALNHPNIITIHEVGQVNAAHFIATEFVEGCTLRSAIEEGAMKPDEAIDVAIQVASALRAAHEAGIVHRDIKPENIMLRPDGYVKVLDFGLAKLTERNAITGDGRPSITAVDTNPGIVMGTVSYMSPEQARGLAIDARTDVFSLGVVLYEMIAGRVPFEGETVSDIIVAILEKEPPPLSAYSNGALGELQAIIDKALQKKKEDRYQTAKEMLEELRKLKQDLEIRARIESGSSEELLAGVRTRASGEQSSAAPVAAITAPNAAHVTGRIKLHKKAAIVVPAAAVIALAAVIIWINMPGEQTKPETPFQPMEIVRVHTVRKALDATISPDGKYVAYVTSEADRQTIWLKQLATNTDTQIVPPTEISYRYLAFSPNGDYLYYIANKANEPRALYQMAATGGPARKQPVRVTTPFSFSPDGKRLAFVRRSNDGETAIIVADIDGSREQELASRRLPEGFSYRGPSWSPDGKVIACSVGEAPYGVNMSVVEVSVEDGTVRPIASRQWSPIHKVSWLRDGSGLVLLAVDNSSWDFPQVWFLSYPGGVAHRITADLSKYSQYHLSLTADSSAILTLKSDTVCNIWVAPDGARSRAKQITFGSAGRHDGLYGLSWTPDGKLVYDAFVSNIEAVFIMNADGTDSRQLTSTDYVSTISTTTHDGRSVFFHSNRAGRWNIWRIDIDGNNLRQVTDGTGDVQPHCSPDGKWLFFASSYEGKPMMYKAPIDGGEPIRLFDKDSAYPVVSPDGKLVAFPYFDEQVNTRRLAVISSETGQLLKSFDIGYYWYFVRWTPDGRAVAYIKTQGDVSNIWAQPLDGGKAVQLTDFKSDLIFNFAWSNDGKQLAIARGSETSDVVMIRDIR
ncbi:MAG TPA: protein kinase [Blastocatellia bacterium]|nr:protein kinase [Blastocatellia bacterium]